MCRWYKQPTVPFSASPSTDPAIDRRAFLAGLGAAFIVPRGLAGQRPRYTANPFSLGVASGDPLADRVILWTRLAPHPLDGGMTPEPVDVQWEVAHDERFTRIVRSGVVTTRAESAHTAHVDVHGLESDRGYWYRFRTYGIGGAIESPAGRTRTAPRADAVVDNYRFAVASCQKYDDGLYTVHRHLADEDASMVVFLGDYIYEGQGDPSAVRPHALTESITLDDYRRRYALHRSDRDLQRAHQAFPWMIVWDDHELFNDYAGQAVSADPAARRRRQAAYQAFAEHMPLRSRLAPGHGSLQMYRQLAIGGLANLCLLDTRQYRSPSACGGGLHRSCPEASAPGRTLLGAQQERWLLNTLRRSETRWQIVAQQIPFAPMDREPGPETAVHMDKWDGYPAARERVLEFLAARGRRDTVVLTGDNHNHWLMDLKPKRAADDAAPIASEFIGSSISSTGDGADQREPYSRVLSEMPHARYLNSRRGYMRCVIAHDSWRTDFRVVPFISRPGAPVSTDAAFVLRHGAGRAERA